VKESTLFIALIANTLGKDRYTRTIFWSN